MKRNQQENPMDMHWNGGSRELNISTSQLLIQGNPNNINESI